MTKPAVLFSALCFSLLLNAFFAGLLVSHDFPSMNHHFNHSFEAEERLDRAVSALDQPYRDKVQALLDTHERKTKASFDHMHSLFHEVEGTLTAPKFDARKIAAIRQQIEDEDRKLKTSFTGVIDEIAGSLPDEQRIAFFRKAMPASEHPVAKPEDEKTPGS